MNALPAGVDRIFLIGFRGAGKSTVGQLLAVQLGWAFADTDDEIEADTGRGINEIFATLGESGFRELEAVALRKLAVMPRLVIATGGGIVLRPENREILTANFAIWLRAEPRTLGERIEADTASTKRRPQLTPVGGLAEVEQLLNVREPHYRVVAQLVVETAGRSPDEVVSAILATCSTSPPICR